MATLAPASKASKEKVSVLALEELTRNIGVELPEEQKEEWRDLIASVQDSINVVEGLPDYVPQVDLQRFPRTNVHRPPKNENPGNAWAWKATIQGAPSGPLKDLTFCLKDNIAVKDVPMLVGTDVFTDYVPDVDASESWHPKLDKTDQSSGRGKDPGSRRYCCWQSSVRKPLTLRQLFLSSYWAGRESACQRLHSRRFLKWMWLIGRRRTCRRRHRRRSRGIDTFPQ